MGPGGWGGVGDWAHWVDPTDSPGGGGSGHMVDPVDSPVVLWCGMLRTGQTLAILTHSESQPAGITSLVVRTLRSRASIIIPLDCNKPFFQLVQR